MNFMRVGNDFINLQQVRTIRVVEDKDTGAIKMRIHYARTNHFEDYNFDFPPRSILIDYAHCKEKISDAIQEILEGLAATDCENFAEYLNDYIEMEE
jgi:hypothetical protein